MAGVWSLNRRETRVKTCMRFLVRGHYRSKSTYKNGYLIYRNNEELEPNSYLLPINDWRQGLKIMVVVVVVVMMMMMMMMIFIYVYKPICVCVCVCVCLCA